MFLKDVGSILLNIHFMCSGDIGHLPKIYIVLLNGSSGLFAARLFDNLQTTDVRTFEIYKNSILKLFGFFLVFV